MKSTSLQLRFLLPLLAILILPAFGKAQHCKVAIQALPNFCDPNSSTITLTVIPTTAPDPPYTYIWSTGATTQTITVPNVVGLITVTVINASGCPATAFYFIPGPMEPFAYFGHCFTCCPGDIQLLEAWWTNYTPPPNITYLWSTGETTPSIETSIPGYYSVTITDPANGCTTVVGGDVFYNEATEVEIDGPATLCSGQTATLSTIGGPFSYYDWFPNGETTPTIEVSQPGTYIVIVVEDGVYCPGRDTIVIEPGSTNIPPPELSGPAELCSGQSGTITVDNANDYIGFSWSTGQTTPAITITVAGTYTVTVTDGGGCTASASFIVDPGTSNMNITGNTMPETSCTTPNGAVDITVTPSGTYDYDWSNGETSQDINNLTSGNYTVTVTDPGGCTATASFTVSSSLAIPTLNAGITSSSCSQSNGAIDLSITPAGTYTFIWSNGATTEDLSNIAALTYSVTVTSTSNGCTATASYTVPNSNPPITITGNTIPYSSCTSPNGSIDITPSPSGTYTYTWSTGAVTEDLTALTAGSYTVTVSAGGTCIQNATFVIANTTVIPALTFTPIAATCGLNNGAIALSVMPAGTYTYLWSNGSMIEDVTAIPGGTYSVTVTSADGCTSSANILVDDILIPLTITGISSPNTSCTSPNGAIDITVNPTEVYSYLWSNGETSEDLNSISSGTYTITVTLGLTCMTSSTFVVDNTPTVILLSGLTTPNTSCSMPNGAIDLTISTPGVYMYLWSNGQTTEDILQLTGGTYTVTVTGEDGCTNTAAFDITNTNSTFTFTGIVLPNTSCSSPNGAIDLTVSPAGTYTFLWSTGASSEDLQNLTSGTYGITVSDLNNCSSVASFSVMDALSFPTASAILSPATCNGNNGAIDLSVTPAAGNSFAWSNGSSTEDLSNLAPGDYSLTITGANGCVFSDTFSILNINSNFTLSATSFANNSCLNPNGSIDLSVTPAGPYTFIWSNTATTEDLLSLSAGSYIVTVTDPLNCMSSDTFTVLNNTITPILSAAITSAICGAANGAIDLMVLPAVNNSFQWSNGAITEDLLNIPPAVYSVIVTDANGCQALDTFTVTNTNSNFSFTALPVDNTSCTSPNGSIDVSVTPSGTYTFLWSNGATTEDLTNLSPGSFSVTITDITSCSSSETFVVGNNTPLITISSTISPAQCGADNGSIDLTINPTAGNLFIWSNGDTNEDIQDLAPGDYRVTVTGPGGCSTADTFTVAEVGSSFSLSGINTANTNCVIPNGTIDLNVSPAGTYTYAWSNGSTSQDQGSLAPGLYVVTVTDPNGCFATESFSIEDQTILPVVTANISPSTCGSANGQIDITVSPAGAYLYAWSNGSASEDLLNVLSGSFTLTATDINGCSATAVHFVPNINSNFTFAATISVNSSCTFSNGIINLTIMPAGTYTFLWSNGAVSEDITALSAGLYSVTVSDASSCSSMDTYMVTDSVVNPVAVETITPVLCGEANGRIDLAVTPSTGNSFLWSDGSITEDLDNILPGQYAVTITSQNGCTWFSGFNVPGSAPFGIQLETDIIQSGDEFVTIRAIVNVPVSALDTIMWLPAALFSCTDDFCLEQTIPRPAAQTEINVIAIDTNGCLAQGRLVLEDESNPKVYIPNVFSPNGDGINDKFTVYGNKDVELIDELQIFDRWGNQVFVNTQFPPNEENYGWDGAFRTKTMNPAVFAYWAKVRYIDGSEDFFMGDVTLVR